MKPDFTQLRDILNQNLGVHKNNPEKFPEGYLFELVEQEKNELVENFDRFARLKHSTTLPKAFSERGLYMLATILKGPRATETTLAIIDTFAKTRELNRAIAALQSIPDSSPKQKSLLNKVGELAADLIIPEVDDLEVSESETMLEMGFPFLRLKKTVKKTKK